MSWTPVLISVGCPTLGISTRHDVLHKSGVLPDLRLRLKRVRRGSTSWAAHFFRGLGHKSSGRATLLECSQLSSVLTSSTVKNSWGAVGLASIAAEMSEWLRHGGGVAKAVPADVGVETQVKPVLKQVKLIRLAHIIWQLVALLFETTWWCRYHSIWHGVSASGMPRYLTPLWQKEPTFQSFKVNLLKNKVILKVVIIFPWPSRPFSLLLVCSSLSSDNRLHHGSVQSGLLWSRWVSWAAAKTGPDALQAAEDLWRSESQVGKLCEKHIAGPKDARTYYFIFILEYNVAVFLTNQMTADPGAGMT